MKKRGITGFSIFLLIILMLNVQAQNRCTGQNVPEIRMSPSLIMNEDESFFYDINTSQGGQVYFSWAPINISIDEFDIDREGRINLTPHREEVGSHKLFVIATNTLGCFDIEKLEIEVYDKPTFNSYFPKELELSINETEYIKFNVNASTRLQDDFIYYEWWKNGKRIKTGSKHYLMLTNYSSSGLQVIQAVAKDSRGLNRTLEWEVNVNNRNRGPYIKAPIPSLIVREDTSGELFNIYNYIFDPDREKLDFEVYFTDEKAEELMNSSKIFDIDISETGELSLFVKAEIYIKQFVRIAAEDPHGMSLLTDPFSIRLATENESAEYFRRQSAIDDCQVDIICGPWSACQVTGIRTRECYDGNNCNLENETILESEQCDYNATCSDGILNQGETGVDCGGPCGPCPTCSDGIINQGEEQVDCGGPCDPCPNCNDAIQNQDETDVDCGGICDPCDSGQTCRIHTDCKSRVCSDNVCKAPTCNDFRQNQGEKSVDCGGPCEPCPTCNDGIINQGEEDIDCGGPCDACITCDDGIRNQGEWFADCGGPCERCGFVEFIVNTKDYLLFLIPIFVGILVIFLVRRMYLKDKRGFMRDFAKIFNFLPKELPGNATNIFISAINELQKVKQELFNLQNKEKLSTDYKNVIDQFFRDMFEIEGSFSKSVLRSKIRSKIKNPFLTNMFLELYTLSRKVSPKSPLFKIELNEKVEDSIRLLNTIREII